MKSLFNTQRQVQLLLLSAWRVSSTHRDKYKCCWCQHEESFQHTETSTSVVGVSMKSLFNTQRQVQVLLVTAWRVSSTHRDKYKCCYCQHEESLQHTKTSTSVVGVSMKSLFNTQRQVQVLLLSAWRVSSTHRDKYKCCWWQHQESFQHTETSTSVVGDSMKSLFNTQRQVQVLLVTAWRVSSTHRDKYKRCYCQHEESLQHTETSTTVVGDSIKSFFNTQRQVQVLLMTASRVSSTAVINNTCTCLCMLKRLFMLTILTTLVLVSVCWRDSSCCHQQHLYLSLCVEETLHADNNNTCSCLCVLKRLFMLTPTTLVLVSVCSRDSSCWHQQHLYLSLCVEETLDAVTNNTCTCLCVLKRLLMPTPTTLVLVSVCWRDSYADTNNTCTCLCVLKRLFMLTPTTLVLVSVCWRDSYADTNNTCTCLCVLKRLFMLTPTTLVLVSVRWRESSCWHQQHLYLSLCVEETPHADTNNDCTCLCVLKRLLCWHQQHLYLSLCVEETLHADTNNTCTCLCALKRLFILTPTTLVLVSVCWRDSSCWHQQHLYLSLCVEETLHADTNNTCTCLCVLKRLFMLTLTLVLVSVCWRDSSCWHQQHLYLSLCVEETLHTDTNNTCILVSVCWIDSSCWHQQHLYLSLCVEETLHADTNNTCTCLCVLKRLFMLTPTTLELVSVCWRDSSCWHQHHLYLSMCVEETLHAVTNNTCTCLCVLKRLFILTPTTLVLVSVCWSDSSCWHQQHLYLSLCVEETLHAVTNNTCTCLYVLKRLLTQRQVQVLLVSAWRVSWTHRDKYMCCWCQHEESLQHTETTTSVVIVSMKSLFNTQRQVQVLLVTAWRVSTTHRDKYKCC